MTKTIVNNSTYMAIGEDTNSTFRNAYKLLS